MEIYHTISIKIMSAKIRFIASMLLIFLALSSASAQVSELEEAPPVSLNHTIETSPLMPFFNIWGVQYGYQFSPQKHLMLGLAYQNIKYKEGRSHSPTIIMGYRHYFWEGLHLEYQLWPAYNAYYENNEQKYYKGFELWNEFRAGYTFDFSIKKIPLTLSLQIIGGFGLYAGNKPESFIKQVKDEPIFIYPILFLGYRF